MKFKEFNDWCNRRCCDGCWGLREAQICSAAASYIWSFPFWKREKIWKEVSIDYRIIDIVEATNQKIKEITGRDG